MRRFSWVTFALCLLIFLALRLLPDTKQGRERIEKAKLSLPSPSYTLLDHPWLQQQPHINEVSIEIEHDLDALEGFCAESGISREEVIEQLLNIQEGIPFSFPEVGYNVIFLTDPQVVQRLYVGKNRYGLPLCIDVRKHDKSDESVREQYLNFLDGEVVPHERGGYLCFGKRTGDDAHGFARQERGLYLDFCDKGDALYVLFIEGEIASLYEATGEHELGKAVEKLKG